MYEIHVLGTEDVKQKKNNEIYQDCAHIAQN